jgi:hypothetical protein
LAIDPELSQVARAPGQRHGGQNYLAHAAPNGDTSASLLMKQDAKWQGLLGENLAAPALHQAERRGGRDFRPALPGRMAEEPAATGQYGLRQLRSCRRGAAVNGDTVYVAVLFSTDLGLKPPAAECPASAITTWDSPAAASAARPRRKPLRLAGRRAGRRDAHNYLCMILWMVADRRSSRQHSFTLYLAPVLSVAGARYQ